MPDETKNTRDVERTRAGQPASDKEMAPNAPGAEPTESNPGGEVTGTKTLSGEEQIAAAREADAEIDLAPDNVQGKGVNARMADGTEVRFDSEEEAFASGGEVTGFTDGEPYVASAPAYLRNDDDEGDDTEDEG